MAEVADEIADLAEKIAVLKSMASSRADHAEFERRSSILRDSLPAKGVDWRIRAV
jgi:hypothetical protein